MKCSATTSCGLQVHAKAQYVSACLCRNGIEVHTPNEVYSAAGSGFCCCEIVMQPFTWCLLADVGTSASYRTDKAACLPHNEHHVKVEWLPGPTDPGLAGIKPAENRAVPCR